MDAQEEQNWFLTGALWPCSCGAALPSFSESPNLVKSCRLIPKQSQHKSSHLTLNLSWKWIRCDTHSLRISNTPAFAFLKVILPAGVTHVKACVSIRDCNHSVQFDSATGFIFFLVNGKTSSVMKFNIQPLQLCDWACMHACMHAWGWNLHMFSDIQTTSFCFLHRKYDPRDHLNVLQLWSLLSHRPVIWHLCACVMQHHWAAAHAQREVTIMLFSVRKTLQRRVLGVGALMNTTAFYRMIRRLLVL